MNSRIAGLLALAFCSGCALDADLRERLDGTAETVSDKVSETVGNVSESVGKVLAEPSEPGVASERLEQEARDAFNPYVLTAHKQNFLIPFSVSSSINENIYTELGLPLAEDMKAVEVKFQMSLKTRINEGDIFLAGDSFNFGITLEAWWQLYANDASSPFRETNYQPEIFYLTPLGLSWAGGNTGLMLGLEHQSNGQPQQLSRSWNRMYLGLIHEKGNFTAMLRPWYRIPEKDKRYEGDPKGDDNPDIHHYMGHADLRMSWRDSRNEYAVLLRGNPATGKGAVEAGWTFPLFTRYRGFLQLFSGYGESLIDYDHAQTRIGLGVTLSQLF